MLRATNEAPRMVYSSKNRIQPCNGVQVSKSNRIMRQKRFGGLHNLESQFNRVSKSVCSLAQVIMLRPLCKAFIGPIRDMPQEVLSWL